MDKYVITLGDFLKNAGIVGFRYMLEAADAKEDSDFGITQDGQGLWIDMDFALNADWTDMYFKAAMEAVLLQKGLYVWSTMQSQKKYNSLRSGSMK